MENIWHGGVKNICVRWSKNILGTVGGKNSMHGRWKKIFGTSDGKKYLEWLVGRKSFKIGFVRGSEDMFFRQQDFQYLGAHGFDQEKWHCLVSDKISSVDVFF